MNKLTAAALGVVFMAFSLGFWAGCTVDTAVLEQDDTYPCIDDNECISGYTCVGGFCKRNIGGTPTTCVDNDDDGYGSNEDELERGDCPQCSQFGRCGKDCNDTDPDINPGAAEPCNGIDDNCNDEVDDDTPCESTGDCTAIQAPANGLVQCVNPAGANCSGETDCTCQVKMQNQICNPAGFAGCPCNTDVQQCVNGSYPALPTFAECTQ